MSDIFPHESLPHVLVHRAVNDFNKQKKHAGSFSFLFSVIKISLHNIYEASIAKIRETGKKKKR